MTTTTELATTHKTERYLWRRKTHNIGNFFLEGTNYTQKYIQHKKPSWGNTSAPAPLLLLKQKRTWVCW